MIGAFNSNKLLRQFKRVNWSSTCAFSEIDLGSVSDRIESRLYFKLPPKAGRQIWYPKHMSIQFDKMQARIRSVDLVIEVHDARIPLTGRNMEFQTRLFSARPHILVMNKRDLIDVKYREQVETFYHNHGIKNIMWTNCKAQSKQTLTHLQKMMLEILQNEHRFNRAVRTEFLVMVVGIPNVGKSSLINSLRTNNLKNTQKAVLEGDRPGVTVRVQNRVRILDTPLTYILDTPGVLNPYSSNLEDTMKLGLCNTILESTLEQEHLADYLLFWMNKLYDYSYLDALGLKCKPTDNIQELLLEVCKAKDLKMSIYHPAEGRVERWNYTAAVDHVISAFRKNRIKDCFLDKDKF